MQIEETQRQFPRLCVIRPPQRQGASPTKALGAVHARGDVLVFLDGHTKPEHGAIERLVQDVEDLAGDSIVTPQVPALKVEQWRNCTQQIGHGYRLDLETFDCGWLALSQLREVRERRRTYYESPALIGCVLAISRALYDKLWGFDRHMRYWGVEDLDFGLKCWLMGHRILHDPEAVIGHRFRAAFDNYTVPMEHVLANQLRMARKHFTHAVWNDWVERCRQRHPHRLAEHPEGLWARGWQLFDERRASVEQERSYLLGRRNRDEFFYAQKFGLGWPLQGAGISSAARPERQLMQQQASPSPCPITITFSPDVAKLGYSIPAETLELRRWVYLTIAPAAAAKDVEIALAGEQRAEIFSLDRSFEAQGKIDVYLRGVDATPAEHPLGDTRLEVSYKGQICDSIPVIVVVPTAIHHPEPDTLPDDVLDAVNLSGDSESSPVWWWPPLGELEPGQVGLATTWTHWMDIRVDDQFGDPLDALYTGAAVEEQLGDKWIKINQNINADGTYRDPVGPFRVKEENAIVIKGSVAERRWRNNRRLRLDLLPNTIDNSFPIPVRVGGHEIGSIIGRYSIDTPSANDPKRGRVQIVWPPPE